MRSIIRCCIRNATSLQHIRSADVMATTQYSGLFGDSYTAVDGLLPSRGRLRSLALRSGFRKYQGLFKALIGAASGGTATKTHAQIAAATGVGDPGSGGGSRTIETVTDISRA